MAYVVTDNCRGCRFTECVTVCPVECFHVGDTMTYIDPENCIDCGGCNGTEGLVAMSSPEIRRRL